MAQVTYSVYRGSAHRKPILDSLTSTLGPTDVFVKITHSGVCSTDEHCVHTPVSLGHEGIGIVEVIIQGHLGRPGNKASYTGLMEQEVYGSLSNGRRIGARHHAIHKLLDVYPYRYKIVKIAEFRVSQVI
ncbi:hypothetical protein DPV78_003566 [Talaromyces pinophilus]|nr:hypothetical protein DPV78_003566 [Talaromyces pinophilus]